MLKGEKWNFRRGRGSSSEDQVFWSFSRGWQDAPTSGELMPVELDAMVLTIWKAAHTSPSTPRLCSEATKQTTFRYRKCSLPCAGAPYTDFPFIHLQSIFLSGLKNRWRYFARLNRQRPRKWPFQADWRKKQMMCTHISSRPHALCLKGSPMGESWAFTQSGGFPWSPARVIWFLLL